MKPLIRIINVNFIKLSVLQIYIHTIRSEGVNVRITFRLINTRAILFTPSARNTNDERNSSGSRLFPRQYYYEVEDS